jgi:transposase InsO family protein
MAVAEEKRIRELEATLTAYIRFYNHRRLHSGIDYHTPEEYERVTA